MNRVRAKTNRPLITSPPGATVAPYSPPSQLASKHVTQSTASQYAPDGLTMPEKTGIASTINRTNTHKHRLIICGLSSIQSEVIARLSRQAELAYRLRKPQKVDAVCTQLEQAHAPIASYFRGLAAQRDGNGDLRQAEKLLEYAADRAPRGYQARALVALGSIAEYRADYRAELEFYRAALKLNQTDVFTAVEARRAIAISARRAGDHARAIQILESILPLA